MSNHVPSQDETQSTPPRHGSSWLVNPKMIATVSVATTGALAANTKSKPRRVVKQLDVPGELGEI